VASSQLFSQLDNRSLDDVAASASIRTASRDELLFNEGDPARAFYLVGTGRVKVFKLSADGKEQILMIAGPGDSFAEAALFSEGSYPASSQALEDTELVVIGRDRFVALLGRNPELAVNLIARLSVLLRKMTKLVEELSLTDVTTRLAHYLIGALDEQSKSKPAVITLVEKKTVLASQLGTIPETLSRSLARLIRDQIISVDGPRIEVLDRARLRQLAGLDPHGR
jgi:CRP/FNR family transcriptional regulator